MQKILKQHFLFEKPFLTTVLAMSIPIALQNMISFGVSVMDSVMLGSLGDIAISAANLGTQPFSILMSCGFGLSSGGSVLIAQYWGKGDLGHIRKVMRLSMQIVFVMSVLITGACLAFPMQIMGLFSKETAVIEAAASYLSLVAFSFIPFKLIVKTYLGLYGMLSLLKSAGLLFLSAYILKSAKSPV